VNRALVVVLLLTGCAQKELPPAPVMPVRTTVYRFAQCEPPTESARLREALRDAAEWKRYAERLEKLPSAKTAPGAHP